MTTSRARQILALSIPLLALTLARAQTTPGRADAARIVGEVFTNGQQLKYVSALSDRIGSRLTGTENARRAEEWAENEMRRLGLSNVRREPYPMAASWERGPASAALVSGGNNRTRRRVEGRRRACGSVHYKSQTGNSSRLAELSSFVGV